MNKMKFKQKKRKKVILAKEVKVVIVVILPVSPIQNLKAKLVNSHQIKIAKDNLNMLASKKQIKKIHSNP